MSAMTTATVIGLGLTAASTAATVGSAMSKAGAAGAGGAASAAAANYRAQVARNNKIIAEQNAERAVEGGLSRAEMESLKGAAVGGLVKAGQAANNVDVNTGSAVTVQKDTRAASQLNAETALSNAQLTAYGYRARAASEEATAGLDTAEAGYDLAGARDASTGALIGGAGSILQNASQLPFGKIFGGGGAGDPGGNPPVSQAIV